MEDFLAGSDDEYLTRVVIDVSSRTFRMYSNEGDVREIECDGPVDFLNILEFIREFEEIGLLDSEIIAYSEPTVNV